MTRAVSVPVALPVIAWLATACGGGGARTSQMLADSSHVVTRADSLVAGVGQAQPAPVEPAPWLVGSGQPAAMLEDSAPRGAVAAGPRDTAPARPVKTPAEPRKP